MTYQPFQLGSRKHVFVDWDLIEPGYGLSFGGQRPDSWEMPFGVRLKAHLPRLDRIPLVTADKPWEGGNALSGLGVYSTLLEDEGHWRLYYDSGDLSGELEVDEDVGTQRVMAYAESSDGTHWVKPELGLVTYRGSRRNNLVFGLDASPGRDAHGATVFKDPSAPPPERYKMVHLGSHQGRFCVFGALSSDGLRWRMIQEPLIANYLSDTSAWSTSILKGESTSVTSEAGRPMSMERPTRAASSAMPRRTASSTGRFPGRWSGSACTTTPTLTSTPTPMPAGPEPTPT